MSRKLKSLRHNLTEGTEAGSAIAFSHLDHREHRSKGGRKKWRRGDHSPSYDRFLRKEKGRINRVDKIK